MQTRELVATHFDCHYQSNIYRTTGITPLQAVAKGISEAVPTCTRHRHRNSSIRISRTFRAQAVQKAEEISFLVRGWVRSHPAKQSR